MTKTKQEFIQDFGEAYHNFGLPKLMGRIVGILLYVDEPVSLDDITQHLNVSKGPVSQMVRRLKEHNLIDRVWVPGDRKDFYRAAPDIFGNAFQNQMSLMTQNLQLAKKYKVKSSKENIAFNQRIDQMCQFYELMMVHYDKFLEEWRKRDDI